MGSERIAQAIDFVAKRHYKSLALMAKNSTPLWRITNNATGEVREVRRQSPIAAVTLVCDWYLVDCDWERVNER